MERSRVNVQFNHQPEQVFEHETDGILCVAQAIEGPYPSGIDPQHVLEVLELNLAAWPGVLAGFPRPAPDYESQYRLVTPRTIYFDVWPLTLVCDRGDCGAVFRIEADTESDIRDGQCKVCMKGRLRQLPYYLVHECGERRQLQLPLCKAHGNSQLAFVDSGSFRTAEFRCRICHVPLRIPLISCKCGVGSSPAFKGVTARDSRAAFPQHLSLITLATQQLTAALRAPYGPHYALGHYLGEIDDLSGLDHGEKAGPGDTKAQTRLLELIEHVREANPDEYEQLRAEIERGSGDSAAIERIDRSLSEEVIRISRSHRRTMERAQLFKARLVDDVTDTSSRARSMGHVQLAHRIDAGWDVATGAGLYRVAVIRDFPIALVGFGYTRWKTNAETQLRSYPPREGGAHPLSVVDTKTEALLVELDPIVLWHWCHANGWTNTRPPASHFEAGVWLLSETLGDRNGEAAQAIRRATHVWSHILVHALAGRSGFDPNSVAEYLLEPTAGVLIYAANYASFNVGALSALVEQNLEGWLSSAIDGCRTCLHDPVCRRERGGCHKCLALAFGCERFNRGLERGYLLGGGTLNIGEGLLDTASRLKSTHKRVS
jgi:hypothetical protein